MYHIYIYIYSAAREPSDLSIPCFFWGGGVSRIFLRGLVTGLDNIYDNM